MRRTELRAVPPVDHSGEPGYREWKSPTWGKCAVCGEDGRLERHHVVHAQHIHDPAKVWDLRNSILVGVHCSAKCHSRHHSAAARIPASRLPVEAIEFAIELLGAGQADLYIDRYYSAT